MDRSKAEGSNRVYRGGSWNNNADNCRVANRNNAEPDNRNNNLGFRAAFVPQIEGMAGRQPSDRPLLLSRPTAG